MEFSKEKVFSAVNAEELEIGSICIFANYLDELKHKVSSNSYHVYLQKLDNIMGTSSTNRFKSENKTYNLAYFIKEPRKECLNPSDLAPGDIVRNKKNINNVAMVVDVTKERVCLNQTFWRNEQGLEEWEKLEI